MCVCVLVHVCVCVFMRVPVCVPLGVCVCAPMLVCGDGEGGDDDYDYGDGFVHCVLCDVH